VAPNRIDPLRETGLNFDEVWQKRIDHPRHGEDVRVLELVRARRKRDG
jgi:hypothetical protein